MPSGPHPPIPAGIGRIFISGIYGGAEWGNAFNIQGTTSGTPSQTDWDNVVQGVLNAYQSHIMPLQSTASTCQEAKGVYVPSPGNELISIRSSTTVGGQTGTGLTAQVAGVISWGIGAYYRGGHPRTYVPAMSNSNTATESTFTTAFATLLETDGAAFVTAVNAVTSGAFTGVKLVTVAYARHNAWLGTPLVFPIVNASAHLRIDTQRRRLGKERT